MNSNPPGIEFLDCISQREMKLVTDGEWKGWIVYRHPDGQWVSLRRATEEDYSRLTEAMDADSSIYWVIGRLHDPQPEDKLQCYDSQSAAMEAATDRASYNDVVAVWDDRDNVVCIFTADQMFIPA